MSLNFALTHQLIGWDGERAYAAICALALVVNVAFNARLIPALVDRRRRVGDLGTELFLTAACVAVLWSMTTKLTGAVAEDVVMG